MMFLTENKRPTMKDLNRYVTRKFANDWENIAIELGLDLDMLKITERDHPPESVACLRKTLDKWIKSSADDVTWKALEVALTNVKRAKFGLDPIDDVYATLINYEEFAKYQSSKVDSIDLEEGV